ncbi:uncharacterized protein K460DRAFT_274033 [Cucurbitaria berberidis CBS 394.84]|uniref:Uncharacterized protein n=1 Tax=Cucurbitaria berberidis CBS 394.84 TaxID=1168544 RepID=A0A9P4LCM9_9PLEO|nr:uncharacterized protein K460DRAFT_274033 [Cucurbitaria berberidis CBS 394.84]KAF1849863.1 hypothetical protein K460DRAFT_274033 [Cucurbitaria berberidis CBS 394.84]
MYDPKPWSGPGVFLNFFKLNDSSKISLDTLEKWFDEEYVPELLATGAIKFAWLYKAANPSYDKQHLAVYKVSDLALVQAGKVQEIPRSSKNGLFDGDVDASIEFDTRIFSFVQKFETSKQDEDSADIIMLALMQPAPGGEADLDSWYRDEHNQQMSEQLGWKRTTRFNLLFQHSNASKKSEELAFLAIHEFGEGNKLGKDVEPLQPISDWTKKLMSSVKAIDAAIYHKVKALGNGAGN